MSKKNYLKYKYKYLNLKKKKGGSQNSADSDNVGDKSTKYVDDDRSTIASDGNTTSPGLFKDIGSKDSNNFGTSFSSGNFSINNNYKNPENSGSAGLNTFFDTTSADMSYSRGAPSDFNSNNSISSSGNFIIGLLGFIGFLQSMRYMG